MKGGGSSWHRPVTVGMGEWVGRNKHMGETQSKPNSLLLLMAKLHCLGERVNSDPYFSLKSLLP